MNKLSKATWIALVVIGSLLIWLFVSIDLNIVLGLFNSIKWDTFLVASLFILGGMQIIPLRWFALQEDREGCFVDLFFWKYNYKHY